MNSNPHGEYLEVGPTANDGHIEYQSAHGGVVINDVSPVFDLPVAELVERFKTELRALDADKTWNNDYDDFDVFHYKALQAIQSCLNHDLPRIRQCAEPDIVVENIGPQAEATYDHWEAVAEAWLEQWLRVYNSLLTSELREELRQLEVLLTATSATDLLTAEDVHLLVEEFFRTAVDGDGIDAL